MLQTQFWNGQVMRGEQLDRQTPSFEKVLGVLGAEKAVALGYKAMQFRKKKGRGKKGRKGSMRYA